MELRIFALNMVFRLIKKYCIHIVMGSATPPLVLIVRDVNSKAM